MISKYCKDWAESGFLGMVASFEGIYIQKPLSKSPEMDLDQVSRIDMINTIISESFQKLEVLGSSPKWRHVNSIFAVYSYEDYMGDAFVLFLEKGKLYEVNGQHRSGDDLCGLWEPEETSMDAIKHRIENGTLGELRGSNDSFKEELIAAIDRFENPIVVDACVMSRRESNFI